MDNKLNAAKNYKLIFSRESMPYRVFATWNIHYACNYKCSYCHAPKPEHPDVRKAVYLTSDAWVDVWKKMYEQYGTWEILVSGGEPFVYPGFIELMIKLSRIHFFGVCTNLEWDVRRFVKYVSPLRVRMETSFHPEFADLDKFVEKLKVLRQHGFEPTVNFVSWPPLLEKMKRIKESVEAIGCLFSLQPFIGQFENRSYPQGHTVEEKEYFKIFQPDHNFKTVDFKTTKESDSTKGKLCRMGQNYVFIHPDGQASRCCRDHTFSLGNIIDGSFKLLEEPVACHAQNCNCWRRMVVGSEDSWWRHWGRYDITDIAMAQSKKTNSVKIALVQPPVWGIFEPPVALAQLSSCLKQESCEVSVFDLNIELYHRRKEQYQTVWAIEQSSFWGNQQNVKKFFMDNAELIQEQLDKIIQAKPEAVGFSVSVCSLPATLMLAERIKQKLPQVKIILGGPMFFMPGDIAGILQHEFIDVIVYGEGEKTFSELVHYFVENRDLLSCKGIYFKNNEKIIKSPPRPALNLNALPFLDLESFPLQKYDPPGHLGNHISLMTSRGCVLNCVYCGPRAYWKGFRFMGGKRIYDEVKYLIQNNPDIEHIEFLDLEFNGNMQALTEFCDLMIVAPLKSGIRWHANIVIRPEMKQVILSKMQQAGCHHLSIGIETGSQRVLDLMQKKYKIEDAESVLKYAYQAGIHVTTNFMFGFPGESQEDFNLTLEFLKRNAKNIGTVYPSRTFCTIEPFSYLAKHPQDFGMMVDPDYNLYWESVDGDNNYPIRLKRCEEFSKLAMELGVSIGLGLQTSLELDRYYNLGFYYDYKKDFKKAAGLFQEYLKLDPKNTVINKKLQELGASASGSVVGSEINQTRISPVENKNNRVENSNRNGKVSFNWDIHWVCNYRCPYCWFYGKWAELNIREFAIPLNKLITFWDRMYNQYGSIKISITGGEPFLYPQFTDLITILARQHTVEVVTNLSFSVKMLMSLPASERFRLHPSFHPLFVEFSDFVDKLMILRQKGLAKNASFVAWPPQIPYIEHYAGKFKEYGVEMFVQPFFGEYKGTRYPEGYSEAERKTMLPYLGDRGGKPFQTTAYPTKDKLCYAGCRYGVIHPDGSVLRCGGLNNQDAKIGNILEDNFRLLTVPAPCLAETCPCNEWAFLLAKDQDEA
jgi:radical SAM superfamily enzyme YgiQ (UPF0313 family)/MoaA/NifB/PqqE/SkfB family radical SAM enzyme